MCGIAGFWEPSRDAGQTGLEQAALRMAATLRHRGPDDQGAWADAGAGLALGHRRLAILDLSSEGHQPMHSADGRYVLVFNGEIYNFEALRDVLKEKGHSFRGHSDTEVMLAALCEWGLLPAVERLTGMFAFALWDRRARALSLVRDRAGEKPLYYGWAGDAFVFGSELKALQAHPRWEGGIDRGALALLVRHGYIPGPHCIYENIRKLPPGCALTLTEAQILARETPHPKPYWSLQTIAEAGTAHPFDGAEEEAGERLLALLLESVARQLVADVPVGAFLSGGIDSSLIVALMQAQSPRPIKTFSIGFDKEGFDEAPFAKAVARHLGTDHTELYVQDEDLRQVVPLLPSVYDEPFADPSQIPTVLLCRLAGAQVKVSLSGDAGDEVFGGYDHYRKTARLWKALQWIPDAARAQLARPLKFLSSAGLSLETAPAAVRRILSRLGNLSDVLPASTDRSLYQLMMSPNREASAWVMDAKEPPTLFSALAPWENLPELLHRMMWLDFVTYLPDDILVKVDRAAMAVSLETRIPLLDHRVVEFAWSLPASFKQRRNQGKWLLRRILHQYVPPALVERPKKGFAAPIAEWLRGPLRDWAEDLLDETRLRQEGFFEPKKLRQRWTEHLSGRRDGSAGLWHALMFQSWLEQQRLVPPRSETESVFVSEAGARMNGCRRATVQTVVQERQRDWPTAADGGNVVLKRAREAAKAALGLGLALLTMNLAALWIYDLPSAPNPLFGDVHQPSRQFRQRIEGSGTGVFTSNCVRRASLPAAGQKPVLMVLGNSYTEATQVEDKDHFAHLLEQRLGGLPVLAMGISSYSVADYIAGAATFKKLFQPDWMIIPIRAADFGANAWNKKKGGGYAFFEWENRAAQVGTPEAPLDAEGSMAPAGSLQVVSLPVDQPGWLSTVTREKFSFWFPLMTFAYFRKSEIEAWMAGHERPWFHAAAESPAVDGRSEETLGKYPLDDEMKLLAKAYEGRLTLLFLPGFDPKNPSKASEAEKELQRLAEKQGVRFVSLREKFPALAAAGRAPYGFSNTRFNWGHWNCLGHEAAAEVLFEELRQLEAIGKVHVPASEIGKQTDLPNAPEFSASSRRQSQGIE